MLKKTILVVIIFFVTGELMMRLDEHFKLFDDTRVVKIAKEIVITSEYKMMSENKIDFGDNNLRVMVMGDSYIAGGGIEAKDRFSEQLKLILKNDNKKYDAVYVLDVSKPSNNTLDNRQSYFEFVEKFKPQYVIIGYNFNDIDGNLDKSLVKVDSGKTAADMTNSYVRQTLLQKITHFYKQSKVLDYVLHTLHNELKIHGFIFPNSVLDVTIQTYVQNQKPWQESKQLLQEVSDDARKKNIELIVLKFPEIYLLEYPKIFQQTENVIRDFYKKSPWVTFINGNDLFKGDKSKDYILSKYDGHPNEKAHKKMAVAIAKFINTAQ